MSDKKIMLYTNLLVFPGVGHWIEKKWLRGCWYVIPTVLAIFVLIRWVVLQAAEIILKVQHSGQEVNLFSLQPFVKESLRNSNSTEVWLAVVVIVVCWVLSVVDAYFIIRKRNEF